MEQKSYKLKINGETFLLGPLYWKVSISKNRSVIRFLHGATWEKLELKTESNISSIFKSWNLSEVLDTGIDICDQ